ncbi:Ser/Thr protein kinase RdoA (MazF antagonist) [Motilibacter rhizosphaerae]|uniref:Ser/Thr protein kinase RdoA (MazF antagonist) n=1 Tax=Motilibacter rhizosphaerae TaxID=598652 RepID=A0A4Q7NSG4_9ACTN|nr:phosphotransferase [Motilibacter rhizosphaerae]RZS90041.1 Ser/Thr protein kinase RdoA (MazF antagonist) [Motilibacter rhizosphaerae]
MSAGLAGPVGLDAAAAVEALDAYGLAGSAVELISISENATWLVRPPGAEPLVLRLNRPGYHSRAAIESELAWVSSLRREGVVRTPPVVPTVDGSLVAALPGRPGQHAVLFAHVRGSHPDESALLPAFPGLGALTARLHEHARRWQRPAGFERFRWDERTSLGPDGHWGRWQDGLGVGEAEAEVLGAAADLASDRLRRFGDAAGTFGLVHADMRLANLLVDDGEVTVIDFDDCGFSWYLYDLAASLSFIEHLPEAPALVDAWVQGYRTEAPLSAEEERLLPSLVVLRRILLVAWIGSHRETEQAAAMGTAFTADSCTLAERYLATAGRTPWR